MANGIAAVHVRVTRKGAEVQGMGQTNTRQKYIKQVELLNVKDLADKKFKSELATAVEKLLP